MEPKVKKILTKLGKEKVDLSLKDAERILQFRSELKSFVRVYEGEANSLKASLKKTGEKVKRLISGVEGDMSKLGLAIREAQRIAKTVKADMPQAATPIEKRIDELIEAYNDMSKHASDLKRIYTELGNVK